MAAEHEITRRRTVWGFPTIHEPEHVAASCGALLGYLCGTTTESSELQPVFVTVKHQKRIFGAKTQVGLHPVKVKQERRRELDQVELFGVRTFITLSEARERGLKLVCAMRGGLMTPRVDGDPPL